MSKSTPEERFWTHVDKCGPEVRPGLGVCWVWTGCQNGRGYGKFGGYNWRRCVYAHRFSWEMANQRKIPPGMLVCHHCDNPSCVRPDHLFMGDVQANADDMVAKGRHRPVRLAGEKNPRSILTASVVREIRDLYATGDVTQRELAARFGVSRESVAHVVTGYTWKEV